MKVHLYVVGVPDPVVSLHFDVFSVGYVTGPEVQVELVFLSQVIVVIDYLSPCDDSVCRENKLIVLR